MAEPIRNVEALQKQINELQELQRQLQFISAQRQQLSIQIEEIKLAEEELSKSEKSVYRMVGPLLFETTKSEASEDLKGKKELFEMRANSLAKQEERLKPRFEELRSSLEKALQAQGKK
ncbi:MAG: prefoldin subunit beta [Candidatus Micrarchaeota archaeon]|nr:prefoldin subunit beta [Candidatus Micrarchaeota archaeon]